MSFYLVAGQSPATGKRVNSRKRHIVVDTCGLLLVVLVTGVGV